jgi:hypothetical protein
MRHDLAAMKSPSLSPEPLNEFDESGEDDQNEQQLGLTPRRHSDSDVPDLASPVAATTVEPERTRFKLEWRYWYDSFTTYTLQLPRVPVPTRSKSHRRYKEHVKLDHLHWAWSDCEQSLDSTRTRS